MGSGRRYLSAPRLVVLPAALLGRTIPNCLRRNRFSHCPSGIDAAGRVTRYGRLLAEVVSSRRRRLDTRATPWPADRLGHGDPGSRRWPAQLPAGDEHHAELGRLMLVRVAVPGPD